MDEATLAVLVRFRNFVGDDTPFKSIRILPPATELIWQDGQLRLNQHRSTVRPSRLSRNEAIDGFIEAFRESIAKRHAQGPVILPLSGGRDSRHILLELCRQECRPDLLLTSRHLPPKPDEDARISALLSRRLGLAHRVLTGRRSACAIEHEKNRRTNFGSLEHAWFLRTADYVNGQNASVFDGFGGDILAAAAQTEEPMTRLLESNDVRGLARVLLRRFMYSTSSNWSLNGFLGPKRSKRLGFEAAVARLESELIKHLDAPNPIGSFLFWNRGRRAVAPAPLNLYERPVRVYMPYLDPAVFDHLYALPPSLTADHALHSDTITRAYPAFRDSPFEDKSAPKRAGWLFTRLTVMGALGMIARAEHRELTRASWIAPRLSRAALSGDLDLVWKLSLGPFLYLQQLERMVLES